MADLSMPTPKPETGRTAEAAALRALLDAVLDAITVPFDAHDYDQRVLDRTAWVRSTVKAALAGDPGDLGWNVDYLRSKLAAEQADADKRAEGLCKRCHRPFDPSDTRFDGAARHKDTRFCRSCVDNCGDGGTEHVCVICEPERYGSHPAAAPKADR
jgi:hypothetical protein